MPTKSWAISIPSMVAVQGHQTLQASDVDRLRNLRGEMINTNWYIELHCKAQVNLNRILQLMQGYRQIEPETGQHDLGKHIH